MVRTAESEIVGVVLAGGASRRMGTDKALTELDGRTMLDWVARTLATVTDRVIVAGEPRPSAGELEFLADSGAPHRGPLAGIATAMQALDSNALLVVVAVDQPWVRTKTLDAILAQFDGRAVVPVPDGIRQTTCAVYPVDHELAATRELNAGGSIQSMLDRTAFDPFTESAAESCGEDGRSWFSVNTATDLEEGRLRYGPPGSG